jgi:GntR family transcriptional regulator
MPRYPELIETRTVHEQLLAVCQQELAAGRWRPGERFPSERELGQTHGISRATANKVLAKLASEGWLELRKGLGAFVADRPTLLASLQKLESFTEFARNQGYCPTTEVLRFEPTDSVPESIVPSTVAPSKGSAWLYLERLRRADGDPVILERRWLPAGFYPGLKADALTGSFYELCQTRYGLRVERQDTAIQAVAAPKNAGAAALHWKDPALRVRGAGYDSRSHLIWAQELFYRGDRFTLIHEVASVTALPEFSFRLS